MEEHMITVATPEEDDLFNNMERLSKVRQEMLSTPNRESRLLAEITVLSEMIRVLSSRVRELEEKYNDKFVA